ncbi:TPA: hypothetical protein DEP86_02325 [Candidatus Uhrbacteria bacterium]|nr:hypothetical protein [Candidatus Uhrbacteria bacterium]
MRWTVMVVFFVLFMASACIPQGYNRPTCMNGGTETVDVHGDCNGPPHPAWAHWERVAVPSVPQNLIEHDGGAWCGEGARSEHQYMWGHRVDRRTDDGQFDARMRCLFFRHAPSRSEWRNAYRWSVATYRLAEVEGEAVRLNLLQREVAAE